MIVAVTADEGTVVVGLTEADIDEMRKGLTKTKQGGPSWGFRSMIVFMGPSDEANIALIQQPGTKRRDDLFPNTGSG